MSMVLTTRSPLGPIGMNGAGTSKRRSARLSHDGAEENEPPMKKTRTNGTQSTTISTKEQDGDANALAKRRPKKSYDEEVDGFAFKKGGRKLRETKRAAVVEEKQASPAKAQDAPKEVENVIEKPTSAFVPSERVPASSAESATRPAPKKTRRRFPTTPERDAAEKNVRRSKRLSDEHKSSGPAPSPTKLAHAKSHANTERSPSPEKARPVTVEKKRKRGANGAEEEEKIMRIALPFQDTPVIKRNKEMRKSTAVDGYRRSSSGMRGRRASSLMDEGRGNGTYDASRCESDLTSSPAAATRAQGILRVPDSTFEQRFERPIPATRFVLSPSDSTSLVQQLAFQPRTQYEEPPADESIPDIALPHAEVPTAEFYKHISAELTENRRMRCLLGWCGSRALPPKPDAPKESTPESNLEFQALQAARVIQEELSQDLITNGTLSDWFSRDDSVPARVPLRKKPNPRNIANAAKAEELERELERLKAERAQWSSLAQSALPTSSPRKSDATLSPLHPDLLDSPQRAIYEQLHPPASQTDPEAIQSRLRNAAQGLEFSIDSFAHGVHSLAISSEVAGALADKTLHNVAETLESREKEKRAQGKGVGALEALRALGKVMNGRANAGTGK